MTIKSETLDAEELLHLAIHASQQSETEKAIGYLKRSLDIEANNAKVLYMLGSLHAEIGLYERAVKEMQQAIDLDPKLYTAQFQLGLLELTSGNVDKAKTAWTGLDSLDEEHYLRIFRDGFLLLIEDKFDESTAMLQKGIKLNHENHPLNNDISNFIIKIDKNRTQIPSNGHVQTENNEDANEDQRILSAYQSDFNN